MITCRTTNLQKTLSLDASLILPTSRRHSIQRIDESIYFSSPNYLQSIHITYELLGEDLKNPSES